MGGVFVRGSIRNSYVLAASVAVLPPTGTRQGIDVFLRMMSALGDPSTAYADVYEFFKNQDARQDNGNGI